MGSDPPLARSAEQELPLAVLATADWMHGAGKELQHAGFPDCTTWLVYLAFVDQRLAATMTGWSGTDAWAAAGIQATTFHGWLDWPGNELALKPKPAGQALLAEQPERVTALQAKLTWLAGLIPADAYRCSDWVSMCAFWLLDEARSGRRRGSVPADWSRSLLAESIAAARLAAIGQCLQRLRAQAGQRFGNGPAD